jgi:hypothetical protein
VSAVPPVSTGGAAPVLGQVAQWLRQSALWAPLRRHLSRKTSCSSAASSP